MYQLQLLRIVTQEAAAKVKSQLLGSRSRRRTHLPSLQVWNLETARTKLLVAVGTCTLGGPISGQSAAQPDNCRETHGRGKDWGKLATTPWKDPPIAIEQLEENLSKVPVCRLVTASAS